MAVRREGDQLTRKALRYTRPCLCSLTKASLTPAAPSNMLFAHADRYPRRLQKSQLHDSGQLTKIKFFCGSGPACAASQGLRSRQLQMH